MKPGPRQSSLGKCSAPAVSSCASAMPRLINRVLVAGWIIRPSSPLSNSHRGIERVGPLRPQWRPLWQRGYCTPPEAQPLEGLMSGRLGIGDSFPNVQLSLVDSGSLDLPGEMDARYKVILFYRGHW